MSLIPEFDRLLKKFEVLNVNLAFEINRLLIPIVTDNHRRTKNVTFNHRIEIRKRIIITTPSKSSSGYPLVNNPLLTTFTMKKR